MRTCLPAIFVILVCTAIGTPSFAGPEEIMIETSNIPANEFGGSLGGELAGDTIRAIIGVQFGGASDGEKKLIGRGIGTVRYLEFSAQLGVRKNQFGAAEVDYADFTVVPISQVAWGSPFTTTILPIHFQRDLELGVYEKTTLYAMSVSFNPEENEWFFGFIMSVLGVQSAKINENVFNPSAQDGIVTRGTLDVGRLAMNYGYQRELSEGLKIRVDLGAQGAFGAVVQDAELYARAVMSIKQAFDIVGQGGVRAILNNGDSYNFMRIGLYRTF